MTSEHAKLRAARADRNAPDHSPACPSCGDLCPTGSIYCAECGVPLTIDKHKRKEHGAGD